MDVHSPSLSWAWQWTMVACAHKPGYTDTKLLWYCEYTLLLIYLRAVHFTFTNIEFINLAKFYTLDHTVLFCFFCGVFFMIKNNVGLLYGIASSSYKHRNIFHLTDRADQCCRGQHCGPTARRSLVRRPGAGFGVSLWRQSPCVFSHRLRSATPKKFLLLNSVNSPKPHHRPPTF